MTYPEVKAIFDKHKCCRTSPSRFPRKIYFDRLGVGTVERNGKRIRFPDKERWDDFPFDDFARFVRKNGHKDRENVYYEQIPEDDVMPTCDEVRKAVHKYHRENLEEDHALGSALDALQRSTPSFGRFLAEVCLIADWGSFQISGPRSAVPFVDRITLAKRIETWWTVLLQPMQSLTIEESWNDGTRLLSTEVDRLSCTDLLTPITQGRPLSFLSKYLHWCVNGAFPVLDGNALKALTYKRKGGDWEDYKNWLTCVRQEVARHEACCLKQVQLKDEHLVRTLDKALYIIGASS